MRRGGSLCAAMLAAFGAPDVLAQTETATAAAAAFEVARVEFDRGLRHLDAKRLDAAIEAFERSLRSRESAAALYNLALAARRAGQNDRAVAALERFIALEGGRPELAGRARARFEDARKQLAELWALKRAPVPQDARASKAAQDPRTSEPSQDLSASKSAQDAQLISSPPSAAEAPIYETWWFWTIAGAIVAAAGAGVAVAVINGREHVGGGSLGFVAEALGP